MPKNYIQKQISLPHSHQQIDWLHIPLSRDLKRQWCKTEINNDMVLFTMLCICVPNVQPQSSQKTIVLPYIAMDIISCASWPERLARENMVMAIQWNYCYWVLFSVFTSLRPRDAYVRHYNITALLQIMACRLFGAKPLFEIVLPFCQLDPKEHISMKFYWTFKSFYSRKCSWKCRLQNGGHFVGLYLLTT